MPVGRIAPLVAIGIGVLALIGWITGTDVLKRGLPVSNSVNPLTALLFILAGTCLLAHRPPTLQRFVRTGAFGIIALAGIVLVHIVFHWPLAPDRVFVPDSQSSMAPMTALGLCLVGFSLLCLEAGPHAVRRAQVAALAVFVAPLVVLVGYLEGVSDMVAIGRTAPMAVPSALGLMALGTGLLLAAPGQGLVAPLTRGGAAAQAGTRLIPAALLLPIGLDWVRQYGERAGWYLPAYGRALPVLGGTFLFIALVFWTAHALAASHARLASLASELALARDRAEQASQAKSRFLTHMSHELRTPLNGILGYAQLMQMEEDSDPLRTERLAGMLECGRHLLQMINAVLDMSQIEADRMALAVADTDVLALCQACLDMLRPVAEAKGLALHLEQGEGCVFHLLTDATRLRQVLLNLLGNALKFTRHGAVTLGLTWHPGGTLLLSVTDTGPGIPPDQRDRLFERFSRLDHDASLEGAGLGLAIASQLVKLMGGEIGCDAGDGGRGTRFWVELPGGAEPLVMPQATAGPVFPRRALRVLVVDDIDMNRQVATALLQASGHKVVCAGGGEAGVREAERGGLDVILMDLRMPGLDGLDATRRIRALGGTASRVPVIAMMAQPAPRHVEACRRAGMAGYVSKPLELALLLQAVEQAAAQAAEMA